MGFRTAGYGQHRSQWVKEVFALDVAGSILVQKYHAEFGEAVDVDDYTDISNGDKLQVTVVEAKPTCSLPLWI